MIDEEQDIDNDVADEELIIRKKKAPQQRTGVTASSILETAASALETLRAKKPLVQCMTNYVAANYTANALLALGASPVMIDDMGEATQMVKVTDALLVNVGTITKNQADAMRAAVSHANMSSKPWVLDPVGVGTLPLRTFTAKELMRRFPAVIRGNASEISFLITNEAASRGVDTTLNSDDVGPNALRLANVTRSAVLVTGATDYIAVEGSPLITITNGAEIMTKVTGIGCAQGAIIAAFIASLGSKARWEATIAASLTVAVAGEMAAHTAKAPGSFAVAFLDKLATLTKNDILKHGKVNVVE